MSNENMSNENNSVQTSFEPNDPTNQPIPPEFEPAPMPPQFDMQCVALGTRYLWKFFGNCILYGVFAFVFLLVPAVLMLTHPKAGLTLTILVYCVLYCIIAITLFKSMRCFYHTPNEIYPNAKKRIILSWSLFLIGAIIANIGQLLSTSFFKVLIPVGLLVSACGTYCFYSFLGFIGKNTLPSKRGCTDAAILMILNYIVWGVFLYFQKNNTLNIGIYLNEMTVFFILLIIFLAAFFALLMYLNNFNKYFSCFYNIPALQKEDSQKHLKLDIGIGLALLSVTILYCFTYTYLLSLTQCN